MQLHAGLHEYVLASKKLLPRLYFNYLGQGENIAFIFSSGQGPIEVKVLQTGKLISYYSDGRKDVFMM